MLLGFLIRVDGSLADVNGWQVLRDFKHVNPGGDEEAQELQNTNVNFSHPSFAWPYADSFIFQMGIFESHKHG